MSVDSFPEGEHELEAALVAADSGIVVDDEQWTANTFTAGGFAVEAVGIGLDNALLTGLGLAVSAACGIWTLRILHKQYQEQQPPAEEMIFD
jgi:hypothetical protein